MSGAIRGFNFLMREHKKLIIIHQVKLIFKLIRLLGGRISRR